jgi:stage II sporulation protein AA (anti-sigma F factor antagonist)
VSPEPDQHNLKWPLRIVEHRYRDVLVLELAGRVGAASAGLLSKALAKAFRRGDRVVMDLSGVDYVSSAGLHALELAADPGSRNGGRARTLVLCAVPEPVRVALDLAGLLPHLQIEPSRDLAVARVGR